MAGYDQSHPLNDSTHERSVPRCNKLRISTTATAQMVDDMSNAADDTTLPRISKDQPLTPASPRIDNESDNSPLPWSNWNSEKPSSDSYHTAPSSATSNSFPASPSSAQSCNIRSASGRSHRARSISSLQTFRRPSNAAPATPSTPSVSNKIKGFISRDKSDKSSQSNANVDSDDPLDQLINSDGTIRLTLTPQRIINLDKPDSKVPRLSAAQARGPQTEPDSLSEFSQFIRSTGPPSAGPNYHQPSTPVAFDTVMESVEVEGGDRSKNLPDTPVPTLSKLINAVPSKARRKTQAQSRGATTVGPHNANESSTTESAEASRKGSHSSSLPSNFPKPPPIPKDDDKLLAKLGSTSKSCPSLHSENAMHRASKSATLNVHLNQAHDDQEKYAFPPSSPIDPVSTRRSPVDRRARIPRNPIRDDCEEISADSDDPPGEKSAVSLNDFLQTIPAPAHEEPPISPISITPSPQDKHHESHKSGTFTSSFPGARRMSRSMSFSMSPHLKPKNKKSTRKLHRATAQDPPLSVSLDNGTDFMRPPSTSASITPSLPSVTNTANTSATAKQKNRSKPSFLSLITRSPKLGSFSSTGTPSSPTGGRFETEFDRDSPYGVGFVPGTAHDSRCSPTVPRANSTTNLDHNSSHASGVYRGGSVVHDRDSPYGAPGPAGRNSSSEQDSRHGKKKKNRKRRDSSIDRDSPYGVGMQRTSQATASHNQSRLNSKASLCRESQVDPSHHNQYYGPIQENTSDMVQRSSTMASNRVTASSPPPTFSTSSSRQNESRLSRSRNGKHTAVADPPPQDMSSSQRPTTPFTPTASSGQHNFSELAKGFAERFSRRKKSVS